MAWLKGRAIFFGGDGDTGWGKMPKCPISLSLWSINSRLDCWALARWSGIASEWAATARSQICITHYRYQWGGKTSTCIISSFMESSTGLPNRVASYLAIAQVLSSSLDLGLAGLKQISSPNKAQTGFVSRKYVPIFVQPFDKPKRYRCPKRFQRFCKGV